MSEKTFKIITLGCKVNQYESAYLQESFINAGWRRVPGYEKADLTVINTCIVTGKASYQSRQAIRKAIKENSSGSTIATGCYAQAFPDELAEISGLGLIAGNRAKGRLPYILLEKRDTAKPFLISDDFEKNIPFEFLPIKRFPGRTRAFLKIQDGCRSFCSYCIVPFARGPLRSLPPSGVISSLETLRENGCREVVLTGIHLGKYGVDFNNGVNLKSLLNLIGKQGLSLRIRLSSINPNEIDPVLIEIMALENWLCPHFHISLQSGDTGVLKRMNRDYTSGMFAKLVGNIHKRMPLSCIGVDVMAGFPGEDDPAFENTYKLINDLPISYLHVFPFSPRKGTAAAGFSEQIDHRVIKERAGKLRKLGQRKREAFYRRCLGSEFPVLAEGWESKEKGLIKGLSDNYLKVFFPCSNLIKNRMVSVRMERLDGQDLIGILQ